MSLDFKDSPKQSKNFFAFPRSIFSDILWAAILKCFLFRQLLNYPCLNFRKELNQARKKGILENNQNYMVGS